MLNGGANLLFPSMAFSARYYDSPALLGGRPSVFCLCLGRALVLSILRRRQFFGAVTAIVGHGRPCSLAGSSLGVRGEDSVVVSAARAVRLPRVVSFVTSGLSVWTVRCSIRKRCRSRSRRLGVWLIQSKVSRQVRAGRRNAREGEKKTAPSVSIDVRRGGGR